MSCRRGALARLAVASLALASLVGPAAARPAAATPSRRWVASWSASPQPAETPLPLRGQTLRQIVHLSLGGSRARVRLSNLYGTAPLHVGSVHLALHTRGPAIVAGSDRRVTFSGAADVVVPPGALLLSDPVPLAVPDAAELAISLYFPEAVTATTEHSSARQTAYVSAAGDFSAAAAWPDGRRTTSWYFLAGVDVEAAAPARAIVAFGDSITDGYTATVDANRRWPDRLAARLSAAHRGLAVVNAGISGNCLLRDLVGANALARLERDVLAQPGVRYVLLGAGVNDIGVEPEPGQTSPTAEQVIAGQRQVIERARAFGLRVIGETIKPIEGSRLGSPAAEAKRQAINQWIRGSGAFDAVIDVDRVLRDPAHPSRLRPAFDSGDHGHPNDAGYQAVADAIDLSIFDDGGA